MDITILGCGVSGLTCGLRLIEAGFQVKILAYEIPPNTTSNTATALWYPYKAYPEERVLGWCKFAYEKFEELSQVEASGVYFVELMTIFSQPVGDPWWMDGVRGFRHAASSELPATYKGGYVLEVPLIEAPIYMDYLVSEFKRRGGIIQKTETEIEDLSSLYAETALLVNCSGIGAKQLCNDDDVYPIRGQTIRMSNPSITKSFLDTEAPAYLFARKNDCIVGGTAEEGNWALDYDAKTAVKMLDKCLQIDGSLKDAEVLEHIVGLRPGRKEVRLEAEHIAAANCWVVHNYGHGGAGFSLSWGCAEEVASLVEQILGSADILDR
ncbi:MAG: FAD-dependent oxidoreductase [Chloroflexota bacterium]